MTTEVTAVPDFRTRQEGEGFVVYVPASGIYLYADATAHDVLVTLKSHHLDEVSAFVAERLPGGAQDAEPLLATFIEILSGRRPDLDPAASGWPLLCPLSDIVGPDAARCETFGMPL